MQTLREQFHSVDGKRLILVADDEWINREMLSNILQDDYNVIFACNGVEALNKIIETKDDLSLVLLDLNMPVMNGLDVLKSMKEDADLHRIPVIVLTSDHDTEVESLTLGAADFMSKPYPRAAVVLARVRRTIELSEDRQIISSTERDPMTGLYNKEYFYRYAEQHDLHHKDMPMDALVIDIYHFRIINERFGTSYGDRILRKISENLKDYVAENEGIVCRRGADTFMVYCKHGADYKEILDRASADLTDENGGEVHIRLRMGVYQNADKSFAVERRFDRAEMAADTIRGSYSKNIEIYDKKLHEKELFAERLIDDFSAAVKEKQFLVYYQPKFDIRHSLPVLASSEALVRWLHPQLGMISPGVFIPLFEENGLIQELDRYVWRVAAGQMKLWKEKFGFSMPVSVNVSRIDMYDPDLIDTLLSIVSSNNLNPSDLLLEVTESAYTRDSQQIIETVDKLRTLGFRIEMDDFGTGYSSLNMISSLPIDALKLDMQLIRSAFRQKKDTRMLEVIIEIADFLSVPVIAEGVETEEQLSTLKAIGCDLVQGYYFSKPIPADEFEKFITDRKTQDNKDFAFECVINNSSKSLRTREKIAQALSGGYKYIFYVDTLSDRYVKFKADASTKKYQVERSGARFFENVRLGIGKSVYIRDRERLTQSMAKDLLMDKLSKGQSVLYSYRTDTNDRLRCYMLKAVKTNAYDDHHIVIGVSCIDELVEQLTDSQDAGTINPKEKQPC